MPSYDISGRASFAVLGAGGRVGSAVVTALLRRGHEVTAIVRDPSRHAFPDDVRLRVRQGDAQRPGLLSGALRGASGVVLAVTPFTAPPQTFDGFDRDYYAAIISGLDRALAGRRLVCTGLTATVELDDGTRFLDHADLFPPFLAPFADAHLRATAALRGTTLDWATLVPPAGFGTPSPGGQPATPRLPALPRTGHASRRDLGARSRHVRRRHRRRDRITRRSPGTDARQTRRYGRNGQPLSVRHGATPGSRPATPPAPATHCHRHPGRRDDNHAEKYRCHRLTSP
jgi:uncharacterized protein